MHKNPANPSSHCHEHRSTHLHMKGACWLVHRRLGSRRCLRARQATRRLLRMRPATGRLLRPRSPRRRQPGALPAMDPRPPTRRQPGAVPAMRRRLATCHHLGPGLAKGRRPGPCPAASRWGRCPRCRLQLPRGGRGSLPPSLLPSPRHPWIHLQRRRIYRSPEPPRHLASQAAVHPWRVDGASSLHTVRLQPANDQIRLVGETMTDTVICCEL